MLMLLLMLKMILLMVIMLPAGRSMSQLAHPQSLLIDSSPKDYHGNKDVLGCGYALTHDNGFVHLFIVGLALMKL